MYDIDHWKHSWLLLFGLVFWYTPCLRKGYPFIFSITLCQKLTDFSEFWYVKSYDLDSVMEFSIKQVADRFELAREARFELVKHVWQPVEQPAASYIQTFNRLFNRLFNRFDNRLCRVNGVSQHRISNVSRAWCAIALPWWKTNMFPLLRIAGSNSGVSNTSQQYCLGDC